MTAITTSIATEGVLHSLKIIIIIVLNCDFKMRLWPNLSKSED